MKKILLGSLLVCAAFALIAAASVQAKDPMMKEPMAKQAMAAKMMTRQELRNAMRMLWEDHIVYTHAYIVSGLAGLEDAGTIAERLLRNQDDIGNAIKPVYGEEAGKKLSALLRDHILIAADIVKAAKAGDNGGVDKGQERWKKNADEIATFLSGANPNWPLQTLKDMLGTHLGLTTEAVLARLKKDWAADIVAYDKGHAHILMLADALSEGILKQFPKKFRK